MPALTRNCRPLLQTAGGKRHASSDDTEDVGAVRSAAAAAPTKAFSRPKLLHEVSPIGKQRIEAAAAQKRASEIVEIEDSPSPRKRPRNATNNKTEAEKTLPSPSSLNSVQTKTPGERNTEKSKEKGKPAKRGKVMDVDLDADPIDSDDLEEVTAKEKQNQQGNTKGPSTEGDPEFKTLNVQPKTRTPAKKTFKRLAPMVSDDELDGSDEEIFPQASRPNPKKKGVRVPKPSGKGTQNLHAPRSSQTKPIVYGKKDKLKREREKEAEEKRQKKAQLAAEKKKQAEPPEFKKISIPTSSQFSANSGEFTRDASPPLSDIPDEDEDDVAMVGLDGQVKIDCPRCGESIAQSLKEDFEDEILKDRRMNFAWQGRFCGYHRKRTAKDQWQLRGYPAIDFSALGRRMGKYDAVLRRILNDERSSHHRQQLKARSKQSKKHQQESVEEGTSRTIMGYYGPKGEKIMYVNVICLTFGYAADVQAGLTGSSNGFQTTSAVEPLTTP